MNPGTETIADGRVPRKARDGLFIARTRKAAFYEVSSEPTYVSVRLMLSKKSFLADERNFSAPLVGPMRGNVRDHIESQQNDHRPSYMPYRGFGDRDN